ncbi:hypothetical protein QZH41_012538, partial [Actinostola sp. cb2023]
MTEEEVRNVLNNAFKQKLEYLTEPKYSYARAIGSKIIKVNNGPFTGKLLKYISKQGPIYIRAEMDIPDEHLKRWIDEKEDEDSSDDGSLMKATFHVDGAESKTSKAKTEVVEVNDETLPGTDGSASNVPSTSTNSRKSSNSDRAYKSYVQVIDLQDDIVKDSKEDNDLQTALLASLEDIPPSLQAHEIAETLRQLESVESSSDFMSFVEKRADFIAVQGYQSIYTAKKEHSKMIKQALLKQYLFY